RLASLSGAGGPITTTHDHTRSSDGRRRLSSHSPAIRDGIWRCAMPKAPRQLPSLPPPSRANPTARANSELDKTWRQGQSEPYKFHDKRTCIAPYLPETAAFVSGKLVEAGSQAGCSVHLQTKPVSR